MSLHYTVKYWRLFDLTVAKFFVPSYMSDSHDITPTVKEMARCYGLLFGTQYIYDCCC